MQPAKLSSLMRPSAWSAAARLRSKRFLYWQWTSVHTSGCSSSELSGNSSQWPVTKRCRFDRCSPCANRSSTLRRSSSFFGCVGAGSADADSAGVDGAAPIARRQGRQAAPGADGERPLGPPVDRFITSVGLQLTAGAERTKPNLASSSCTVHLHTDSTGSTYRLRSAARPDPNTHKHTLASSPQTRHQTPERGGRRLPPIDLVNASTTHAASSSMVSKSTQISCVAVGAPASRAALES